MQEGRVYWRYDLEAHFKLFVLCSCHFKMFHSTWNTYSYLGFACCDFNVGFFRPLMERASSSALNYQPPANNALVSGPPMPGNHCLSYILAALQAFAA